MLSKEQLKAKCLDSGRRYRLVTLADGSQVRLQSLTRSEQRDCRKATQKKDGTPDPTKMEFSNDVFLSACIVDESGAKVFTTTDALSGIFDSWDTLDTTVLVDATIDHCGLIADAKDIEARIKNSKETPGNGSYGGSASDLESPKQNSTSDSTTITS